MRVLIIKTSSLGDVVHTLPALTDAGKYRPEITFDWIIEPAFAEIPRFHPLVKKIMPAPLRRWRKNIFQAIKNNEWQNFYRSLRSEKYDLIIDAQGLIKSGFLTFLARGIKCGYDRHSAWEPLACLAYHKKCSVKPEQHAITRIRQLFAQSLGYACPADTVDYGVNIPHPPREEEKYIVLLHGTTREDKYWPESHWAALIDLLKTKNIKILLPWGNDTEKKRAGQLAYAQPHAEVLPKLSLSALASLLKYSTINIAVDTGLGHLSAALDAPTISLYGPTDPALIGTVGKNQLHLKADKMQHVTPKAVMDLMHSWL